VLGPDASFRKFPFRFSNLYFWSDSVVLGPGLPELLDSGIIVCKDARRDDEREV
jgi:hypothetical protein